MTDATLVHTIPRPPSSSPKPGTFRPDIEGLRAVAVCVVVAFHAGLPLMPGGYVGVDAFFVLSGFLITGMLLDEPLRTGRVSISGFYARRVRRLLPLSALVLVATAFATVVALPTLSQAVVAGDLRASPLARPRRGPGATQPLARPRSG